MYAAFLMFLLNEMMSLLDGAWHITFGIVPIVFLLELYAFIFLAKVCWIGIKELERRNQREKGIIAALPIDRIEQ